MKKIITILLVIFLLLTTFSVASSESTIKTTEYSKTSLPESNLIENVPYVGQYDNFHCAFATKTMIINYFQKNTTLEEIIYLMGNAYSLYLSKISQSRIPTPGVFLSQAPIDSEFIAELFGLSFDYSFEGNGISVKEEYWNSYWNKIKENLSQNIPLETSVSPFKLSSIQNLYDLNENIWNKLNGGHAVVIVGYNESNETVCYNDPATLLYGGEAYGTYAWMSIEKFKDAVETTQGTKYLIYRFQNLTNKKNKSEMMQLAHLHNIEKMKGNKSVYGLEEIDAAENCLLGISALKQLNDFYKKGFNNRTKTIIRYKLNGKLGLQYSLIKYMQKILPNLFDNIPFDYYMFFQNTFDLISIEKTMTAEYLENQTELDFIFEYNSHKLKQEAENWSKIADLYREFKDKGILMNPLKTIKTINEMQETVENIIKIEEDIIQGTLIE